ncbi:MAG: UDP-2,3-diacylglucosamine diphosphatase [Gammaproteobacteria bacterium]
MSQKFSTVWISDIHLGTRACRVDMLIDFLDNTQCDKLYLVGDIVDLERLRSSFYWPPAHTKVLRKLLKKCQQGTEVIYIPGNHDDEFRSFAGQRLGPIEVRRRDIHVTQEGKRLLILHGDEFDRLIRTPSLANIAGSIVYRGLLVLNRLMHWWHEVRGLPYWSLAQHVKSRLGKAVRYVQNFQNACVRAAQGEQVDGVVCGHIHQAAIIEENGFTYCNDGDWVESCTAVVEREDGTLELLTWSSASDALRNEPVPLRDAA